MALKITQFNMMTTHESENTQAEIISGTISFTAASNAEALAAYRLLAGDLVKGWNLSAQGSGNDDKPVAKATKPTAKATKLVETPPLAVEETSEDEDESEDGSEDEAENETPAETPQKISITGEDIRMLKDAKKLRDVLTYLINTKNIKTKRALVKTCAAIKDKVPALARIEDLEERIPGAVELLDPSVN